MEEIGDDEYIKFIDNDCILNFLNEKNRTSSQMLSEEFAFKNDELPLEFDFEDDLYKESNMANSKSRNTRGGQDKKRKTSNSRRKRTQTEDRIMENINRIVDLPVEIRDEPPAKKAAPPKATGAPNMSIPSEIMSAKNKTKKPYYKKFNELIEDLHDNPVKGITAPISENEVMKLAPKPNEPFGQPTHDSLSHKLAKNRESAKNSRERKKIYITLLENKIKQLTKELTETKTMLDASTQQLHHMCRYTKIMAEFIVDHDNLLGRLEKSAKTGSENDVLLIIDALRLRFDPSGNERLKAINFLFSQIAEKCLPSYLKYLYTCATENKDFYRPIYKPTDKGIKVDTPMAPTSDFYEDLIREMKVTEEQKQILFSYKPRMIAQKSAITETIRNIFKEQKKLLDELKIVQVMVDELKVVFTPKQIAPFVLTLHKNYYKKEYKNKHFWGIDDKFTDLDDEDEDDEPTTSLTVSGLPNKPGELERIIHDAADLCNKTGHLQKRKHPFNDNDLDG